MMSRLKGGSALYLVLILVIGSFCDCQSPPDHYALNMHYPKISTSVRSNPGNIFSDANTAYSNRDFKKAANIYAEANPSLLKGNIYYGICLLETEHYTQAREIFDLIASQKSTESPLAQWLLAMSYLKEDKIETTKKVLSEIDDQNIFYLKAGKLLEVLEN